MPHELRSCPSTSPTHFGKHKLDQVLVSSTYLCLSHVRRSSVTLRGNMWYPVQWRDVSHYMAVAPHTWWAWRHRHGCATANMAVVAPQTWWQWHHRHGGCGTTNMVVVAPQTWWLWHHKHGCGTTKTWWLWHHKRGGHGTTNLVVVAPQPWL